MITINKSDFWLEVVPDESPDTSYLEQEGFADRLAEYNREELGFVGIRATVEVLIPCGTGHIIHRITSPGLWGVESDSGKDYLQEVFAEESDTLTDMLKELGVQVDEKRA